MKPYYGALNAVGQWWDGHAWRRMRGASDQLMQFTTYMEHDAANCHMDGVFQCPRCRRQHYLCDNFDLLCDGCVSVLADMGALPAPIAEGLALWAQKRRDPADPDIAARRAERERLAAGA